MTWTKLSDDFPDDCQRAGLSDNAFRTHVEGLIWSMRRENDGLLDSTALRRFGDASDPSAGALELVAVGFWTQLEGGWQIEHHMEHQPEADLIGARRQRNAERQQRKRRTDAGLPAPVTAKIVPSPPMAQIEPPAAAQIVLSRRDDPRDDPRDPGRDGTGRDGSEEKYLDLPSLNVEEVCSDNSSSPFRRPPLAA